MRVHHFVGELADGAGSDASSVGENAEFAAHAAREWELLLDQKHSEAFFFVEPEDDVADFVDDIGLDAFGGLVEDQQLRLKDERPAYGELLLLSAGEVAAAAVQHLLEHGKQIEDALRNFAVAVLAHAQADARDFRAP